MHIHICIYIYIYVCVFLYIDLCSISHPESNLDSNLVLNMQVPSSHTKFNSLLDAVWASAAPGVYVCARECGDVCWRVCV